MKNISQLLNINDLLSDERELFESLLEAEEGIHSPARGITRAGDRENLPLSFAQQRMWFLNQMEPDSPGYNIPGAMRLEGPLDVAALDKSINEIVRRHEVLRTTFSTVEGRPVQIISARQTIRLEVLDLSDIPEDRRAADASKMAVERTRRPFDLSQGPLLRADLLRLATDKHILLLTVHHIACDGWSIGILIRELATLYQAFSAGRPSPLAELEIQYADFAAWQRASTTLGDLEEQLEAWKQQLGTDLPVLELPTDHPRPPVQGFNGAVRRLHMHDSLSESVRQLGRGQGATLFMTLMAAFQALLFRYTGQRNILVGAPVANRDRLEIEDLIGCFVNTLVLRTELSAKFSFKDLLRRVREAAIEAYSHQDLPFEKLVEELQTERGLSHSALFQVMLTLESAAAPVIQPQGLTMTPVELDIGVAKFDLTLSVTDAGDRLEADFEYNTDLFEASSIDRMLGHLEVLLRGVVSTPDEALSDLPLLTEAETRQLLIDWNLTESDYANDSCLHELFEAQVERTPHEVALIFGERRLTYRELNGRANRLADCLRGMGVGAETRVAICAEPSVEMVVGLLAILKAGGAFVPLNPAYPKERLEFMLEDSQAGLLLIQSGLRQVVPPGGLPAVYLDDWDAVAARREVNLRRDATGDNLAYVIYTSGSTGKPKGVMLSHSSACNYFRWMQSELPLTVADRLPQKYSINFDAAVGEIFYALLAGAGLIIVEAERQQDTSHLIGLIDAQGVTVIDLVPSLLQALLNDQRFLECRSLRRVICGSEALTVELQRQFFSHLDAELYNLYGPTEAAISSTFWNCRRDDSRHSVPIGRPIANTEIYILDPGLKPRPVGVPGELHIGAKGLARGYLNRPGLTAEKFIPDPFGVRPGARLYKTGDLARYLADGNVEFLGRVDDQVNIRGFRIELGEIESRLKQHPAVLEVVVAARDEQHGARPSPGGASARKRLAAYLVLGEGRSVLTNELRAFLAQELPDYMLPSDYVFLEALPLTRGGKVDRRALPAPAWREPEEAYITARTPVEKLLARIWAEVLCVERVGINDNFFELGGDSILSIQVLAKANQAGLHLTPRQFFQNQTISKLALLAGAQSEPAGEGIITGPVPLTPIQHWFFEQPLVNRHHYNQAVMLRPKQPLDARLLSGVVNKLVEHHDGLRLRFRQQDGAWHQFNAGAERERIFSAIDLSALEGERLDVALHAAGAELQSGLNISEGPLIRVVLFDLGAERAPQLLLVIHHLAVDGVSWRILIEDIDTAYGQLSRGEPVRLPPKTSSFKHWSERLAVYARANAVRREFAHWLATGDKAAASIPVDYPGRANTVASARAVSVSLGAEETRALLKDVNAAYHTRINDVLLTAIAQAFSKAFGRSALLIDLEGHGREQIIDGADVSRTVGWFTTISPALLKTGSGIAPAEALKRVKEQLRGAANHGIGYGVLRYLAQDGGVTGALAGLPRAEVSFNYLGQLDQALSRLSFLSLSATPAGPTQSGHDGRPYLIEIEAQLINNRLCVEWVYSEQLHHRSTIERLADAFLSALITLIEHCSSPGAGGYTPSDFPLAGLSQQELDELFPAGDPVEDIYPLSPMQQGMLFHSLYDPRSDVYCTQLTCALRGELDTSGFEYAWQRVVDRHAILRTAFIWSGLPQPLQVVHRRVRVSVEELNWEALHRDDQEKELQDYLRADRARGINLSEAPLMRLALVRVAPALYRLVWTSHHALMDGWCLSLLLKEVCAFYDSAREGKQLQLARPRPYRDYIAWLRRQELSEAETFWRRALEGFKAPTRLMPRPESRGAPAAEPGYAEKSTCLSAETTACLRSFVRQHRLTLNTLVQGMWALLSGRYSGEQDVVFGVVVSGRAIDLDGIESMMGLFINTLPLRVEVPAQTELLPWLKQIQERQMELQQYEHSPLAQIQAWSDLPGGVPLFESILVFENYPFDALMAEQGDSLRVHDVRSIELTNYPLTLMVAPGDELSLKVIYDGNSFDEGSIAAMLGHLRNLLEEASAGSPHQPICRLTMLPAAERRHLLFELNDTGADYPAGRCVVDLFEDQVESCPDSPAVVFGHEKLTYVELNRRANQLARHLQKARVGPEKLVGICLERSVEMVMAVLGVLKAGGAYLPLDPDYPKQRLAFMLEDAGVSILVSQQRLAESLPEHAARLICIDSCWPDIATESEMNLGGNTSPDNLAYVIYTSGSTGLPKGAALSHGSLFNLICWQLEHSASGVGAKTLQFASLSFDVSFQEIFSTWCSGGTLVLVPEELRQDASALLDLLAAERIQRLFLPFVVLQQIASINELRETALKNLREVITAGEQLRITPQVINLFGRLNNCSLHNQYGPTECHAVTAFTLTGAANTWPLLPPIGRPIANAQIYLLDSHLQPLPVGVPGDLYVGGAGVGRGYLNRPDLTGERFIPDEYGGRPGARLYKTGDRARYLGDGSIEFVGRAD
ncbi:MAG: amino acid adenylation domain-containing protein, partial [Blastocatellia bacterium]